MRIITIMVMGLKECNQIELILLEVKESIILKIKKNSGNGLINFIIIYKNKSRIKIK
jgi:hypothetical protein